MDLVHEVVNIVPDLGKFNLTAENIFGVFSNLTLLTMMLTSLNKNRPFPKTKSITRNTYDYIIVGGGTAGSVMANRLSEKPCATVLLLEAGGEAPLLTDVPAAARLFHRSSIDWSYEIEPQKHCCFGQKKNKVLWNSGKALGGGSVLNAMLYVRGNKKNYDEWAAGGAAGWSYKDVLPYFLKLEDNRNIEELDPGFHQEGGPMTAEKPNYEANIKQPILEAMTDMGFDVIDVNGERPTGINDFQATIRNQQRCSTAKAYLVPAENRPNLDIVKNAFVKKIIIRNKRAVGVEVDYLLTHRTVRARKEVIVSNGAVRTPQLLMLSGIGPRAELEKFNIDVVADLPVGKNLQDHYASSLIYEISGTLPIAEKNLLPTNILDYIINRHGPNASPNQVSLMAFVDGNDTSSDNPLQQLYFSEYAVIDAKFNFNLEDEVFKKYYAPYISKPLYICVASLLQPHSRGEVTLRSTDPYDQPKIDPHYYEDKRDFEDVVKGMKLCQAVAEHPAMKKINTRHFDTVFPGCEDECDKYLECKKCDEYPDYEGCDEYPEYETSDESSQRKICDQEEDNCFRCIVRHLTHTIWHPVGTARMGHPRDTRSVVDPQLRVIGVRGLRVVNAAVMPIIPSGNTNVPTMMVAEKAYDMMKNGIMCDGTGKIVKKPRRRCRPRGMH